MNIPMNSLPFAAHVRFSALPQNAKELLTTRRQESPYRKTFKVFKKEINEVLKTGVTVFSGFQALSNLVSRIEQAFIRNELALSKDEGQSILDQLLFAAKNAALLLAGQITDEEQQEELLARLEVWSDNDNYTINPIVTDPIVKREFQGDTKQGKIDGISVI